MNEQTNAFGAANELHCHLKSRQTELKPYKNLKRALACLKNKVVENGTTGY